MLSSNNPNFGDLIHRIYPKELGIKDATDTVKSALYLDLHLEVDGKGKPLTKLYDKRDPFSFNFPFICGNIPSAPAYGVYVNSSIVMVYSSAPQKLIIQRVIVFLSL